MTMVYVYNNRNNFLFFQVYDYTIIYRYLLMSGCLLFLLIGLGAYFGTHIMEPVYAKSLRRLR